MTSLVPPVSFQPRNFRFCHIVYFKNTNELITKEAFFIKNQIPQQLLSNDKNSNPPTRSGEKSAVVPLKNRLREKFP